MPVLVPRRTPGVYVTELDSFPPSIVGVQTAVPGFIGYTEKAEINGKPVGNKPIAVGSMADFMEIFGTGYIPDYDIQPVTGAEQTAGKYDFQVTNAEGVTSYYRMAATSDQSFNLYNSMRLFYANGGGNCYVVSVGTYTDDAGAVQTVAAGPLQEGLNAMAEQTGPTMLVVPDAVLLPPDDAASPFVSSEFQQITRSMLEQCVDLQDRVAILDVYGAQLADKNNFQELITRFREVVSVDTTTRSYGMAYFPFLDTTVVPLEEITFADVSAGSQPTLREILTTQNDVVNASNATRQAAVQADIDAIPGASTPEQIDSLDMNLSAALPVMKEIKSAIVQDVDLLPASGAMAGVFTYVDQNRGVWNAPANVSLNQVTRPSYKVNNSLQADLNVPVDGKAIDVIREFTGQGTIVWGARTLDGNSNDYRYIQVRRTLIYIEQSIKAALLPFVFAANDGNTWSKVVSMASNFLQTLWSQGGLMGATAQDAFSVQCGLGSTMTPTDILEGYMIVQVTLQMIRPAEFIELTIKQKMEG